MSLLSKFLENIDFKMAAIHIGMLSAVFYLGCTYGSKSPSGSGFLGINKSFESSKKEDLVTAYTLNHSTPLHPTLKSLMDHTLENFSEARMMGAPEVTSLNSLIIKTLKAKKILDIGVFTGSSALAAALAMKDYKGKVIGCDVNENYMKTARKFWAEAGVEDQIEVRINPAGKTLQSLIEEEGQVETFDFAFIDADKVNYNLYYEKCLKLLRVGGVIAFDNTLWSGNVITEEDQSPSTVALRDLNNKIAIDSRVYAVQINIGDGYTLVSKL